MLTLAHLSDVHLAPLPRLAMKELRGKRLFGYQSWRFRRRHIHEQRIANLIAADVRAANPDHIALTGDLINLSAKLEFDTGAAWLAALGRPDQLTFVPGNHDAYVPMAWDKGLGLWSAYMTGDLRMAGAQGTSGLANPFPFVRQRRNIALIGVSTALPQPTHCRLFVEVPVYRWGAWHGLSLALRALGDRDGAALAEGRAIAGGHAPAGA